MVSNCIRCEIYWCFEDTFDEDQITSGLCPSCFRELMIEKIHKEQSNYSGIPCFMTAKDYCSQNDCRYKFACLEINLKEWERNTLLVERRKEKNGDKR